MMIDKRELKNLVERLENGVDKFIVVGLFYGLNGSSSKKEQLLNITVDDINFDNSTITLSDGRVVVMDSFLEKIAKEACAQKCYVKLGKQGNTNADYFFNEDSKYVIKVKPTKKNNNGLEPLGVEGYKCRLKAISKYLLGNNELTANTLKQSGAYSALLESEEVLTVDKAEAYLASKGLRIGRGMLASMLREINEKN